MLRSKGKFPIAEKGDAEKSSRLLVLFVKKQPSVISGRDVEMMPKW